MQVTDKNLKRTVMFVAIIEPFASVPQIIEIYTKKDATSVSLLTWLFFTITTTVWLTYGIKIKDRPLITTSTLALATDLLLLYGVLLYK